MLNEQSFRKHCKRRRVIKIILMASSSSSTPNIHKCPSTSRLLFWLLAVDRQYLECYHGKLACLFLNILACPANEAGVGKRHDPLLRDVSWTFLGFEDDTFETTKMKV